MTQHSPPDDVYEDPVIDQIDFAGKDVLEIGCGTGSFTLEYLTQANSVLGIDRDIEAIDYLKAHWPKPLQDNLIDFRPGDVVDLQLSKEAFDIAVFSHSF